MLDDDDFLNRRYYGGDLDPEAERNLHAAALAFSDAEKALGHLQAAQDIAPDHMATAIAFYKFYLYKHRLDDALMAAKHCLSISRKQINAPEDYQLVGPETADFNGPNGRARTYLFSLMAYGYILARLGRDAEARPVLEVVSRLDNRDSTGAKGLLGLMDSRGNDED